jgi:hypothetical protein
VADRAKPSAGRPPTRWVGDRDPQLGMRGFELAQLAHERVELGVRDLGLSWT